MSTRWTKWTLNAIAAILLLAGTANATSLCSITGVILDGAGNPVPNATIYFNSQNTQVVNGITIYPILKNSTTDANGNLSSTALQQGLFVQITICQAQGGGCAAPITGFVPVTGTTTFQNLLSGTLVSIGSSLSGNLNASGYRILNLGANTTTGDALSQGVSHLGDLATNNANYNFGGYKFQNLAAGTVSGDSLAFGLNHLNDLATATASYSMGTHRLTSVATATTAGDALSEGNPIGLIQPIPQLEAGTATASTSVVQVAASANLDIGLNVGLSNGNATTAYGIEVSQSGVGAGYLYEGVLNTTATSIGVAIIGGAAGQPLYQGTFQSGGPGPFSVSTNGLQKPMSAIASLPSCGSITLGFTFVVNDSDSACSFNSAPTHSTCTVGTNCYTCQVQCAEAGSTSYAWIAY